MNPYSLILFAIVWFVILYLFNSLLAGGWKKIVLKQAALYFSTVAMIGIYGEIFLDTAYKFFVGHPLWHYNMLPIHNAYTSTYAAIIWGAYGFHLYLLHGTLGSKWSISRTKHLAFIFCIEALIIEALATISARIFLGKYLYYYIPGDLWHVSSFQNIPFYFICGVLIIKTLKRFKVDPVFFSAMSTAMVLVIVFLV
jgi:hypothetical protein